ncbi:MAG: RsbRD N-terminal domain-containing protein [Dehalococcoidia bacterium]|nr:RsbRD N-terminal domain-containing protein [Dehalococcoidia bacterium]
MNLTSLLLQKKETVLRMWLRVIFEPCGPGNVMPLPAGGDRFTDPVGYTISNNAAHLLNALIKGDDPEASRECLEKIIRIRAVQDLTQSQAVGFMTGLKMVMRSLIMEEVTRHALMEELNELEKRIDCLGHISDELYVNLKRQIRELAIKETKKDNDFKARIISIRKM